MNNYIWQPQSIKDAYNLILFGVKTPEEFYASSLHDAQQIISNLELEPEDQVCEIGVGVGRLARHICQVVSHLYGLDITDEMINFCIQEMSGINNFSAIKIDKTIPLENNSMDAVYSHLVFQHNNRYGQYTLLKEVHRILRPSAWASIQISNLYSETGWERFTELADQYQNNQIESWHMKHEHLHPAEFELYCNKLDFYIVKKISNGEELTYIIEK